MIRREPKTSSLPPIRIDAKTKRDIKSHLRPDETVSSFVAAAVQESLARRALQEEFIARGITSAREARRTGDYVSSDEVLAGLDQVLRGRDA